MLTPELLAQLRSPSGIALLERAEPLAADPFAAQKLRAEPGAELSPELAAAAVEQVRLRGRAFAKFARGREMWFSPALLEQASGETVARHRARRFARWAGSAAPVGDLCCGLGADALFMAEHAPVVAVDRDPLALALTEANLGVFGRAERVTLIQGTVPGDAPDVTAAWVDPARREGGAASTGRPSTRTRRLDAMSPTLAQVLSLRERIANLGIKLSPASADAELDAALAGIAHERELLSVGGECRELALWIGALAEPSGDPGSARGALRRATLLPAGAEVAGIPVPYGEIRPPGSWLLEPDGAVIRAGLVGNIAETLGAWPIDPQLAYLSIDSPPDSPFVRVYRIEPPEPFSGKALSARLRRMGASDVVFKTRGAAVEPEVLRRQLRGVLKQGKLDCRPIVFLTRLNGRAVMMLGERFGPGTE